MYPPHLYMPTACTLWQDIFRSAVARAKSLPDCVAFAVPYCFTNYLNSRYPIWEGTPNAISMMPRTHASRAACAPPLTLSEEALETVT